MKKRLLTILLLLSMVLLTASLVSCDSDPSDVPDTSSTPESTSAPATTEPSAQPEPDNPDYLYSVSEGQATIIGYKGSSGDLKIPAWAGGVPVTAIADYCFMNDKKITSVEFPASLQTTGQLSFFNCVNLTKVVCNEGLTIIDKGAFDECTSLSEIRLPSTLTILGEVAFQNCVLLPNLTLPESLNQIGYRCFAHCTFTEITIPAHCRTLGPSVFSDCRQLEKVTILSEIHTLPDKFFENCFVLNSVQLPRSVESIGSYAFSRCESIKEIDLGNADYLCDHCLWGCLSLEKIYLHTTKMDRVFQMVFSFVPSMTDIYYAGTMDSWENMRRFDDYNYMYDRLTVHADWQEDA